MSLQISLGQRNPPATKPSAPWRHPIRALRQRTRRQETGLGRAGQRHFPAQAGPLVLPLLLLQVLADKSGATAASCTGQPPQNSILQKLDRAQIEHTIPG